MRSAIFMFFVTALSFKALANGLPEGVALTDENSSSLGFGIVAENSGAQDIAMATVHFPKKLHGSCTVGRVQSFLLDSKGNELSATSADYIPDSQNPTVLIQYNSVQFDMVLQFQYLCPGESESKFYKYAYRYESLNKYLVTRR